MSRTIKSFGLAAICGWLLCGWLPASAQQSPPPLLVMTGESDDDRFGCSVASAGDANGDGLDDWVIGASGWGAFEAGKIYLYEGSLPPDDSPDFVTEEVVDYGAFGSTVAGIGDIDGDQFGDIAVRSHAEGPLRVTDVVRVFYGAPELADLRTLDLSVDVPFCFGFGHSISAGDFDCDGFEDVIIGAFEHDRVLYDGSSSGLTDTTLTDAYADWKPGEFVGYSLIPNVNTTILGFWPYYPVVANTETTITVSGGPPWLPFSAQPGDPYSVRDYRKGAAYIYFGGLIPDGHADLVVHGSQTFGFFGYAVAGVGDVNQDGCEDFVVGAYENDQVAPHAGRAYLFLGDPGVAAVTGPAMIVDGPEERSALGFAVSGVGDIDGDGFDDFAIGLPKVSSPGDPGQVWVYLGGPSLDEVPDLILEEQYSFGNAIAGGRDVDGDLRSDIVVGAPYDGDGRVFVYTGGDTPDRLADAVMQGEPGHYLFGQSVALAGSVDVGGSAGVLVGTYDAHIGSPPPYNGKAFLIDCTDIRLIFRDGFESGDLSAWSGRAEAHIH